MRIRSFCLLTFALPSLAAAADCAAALRIALPNAHITAASAVPSNDSLRALGQKPYCRVEATVDTETHIVALLPDDWNGRFLMGGAGGYVRSVANQFASTVHEGYATVGTDAGHTAFALMAGWALRNDRRIADYGHRAVHRTAEVTKALIVAYYGRPPEHSYFIGCSNGGREALMEAQRYPADFDGIVAIAPLRRSGCDDVDYAGMIRRWVEQAEAPSRIIARKLRDTQVVRTHPLCAYPMRRDTTVPAAPMMLRRLPVDRRSNTFASTQLYKLVRTCGLTPKFSCKRVI